MSAISSDLSATDVPPTEAAASAVARALRDARSAQPAWAAAPLRHRLKVLRRLRHRLAARPDEIAFAATISPRQSEAEAIATEVLPLADACKWLERDAAAILAPRRLSRRGRPFWQGRVEVTERRDPIGIVLVIGARGQQLFVPGVQIAQALAGGNAVLLKPGRGAANAADALRDTLVASGLDPRLLAVLHEASADELAIDAGVDHVVLNGSSDTGRSVLARLAETLTPAVVRLSGCKAVFVRGDANLELVASAIQTGLALAAGVSCIAPWRVFAHRSVAAELESKLARLVGELEPVTIDLAMAQQLDELIGESLRRGGRRVAGGIEQGDDEARMRPMLFADTPSDSPLLRSDLAAPILLLLTVGSDEEALQLDQQCPYAADASVFGRPEPARELAARIDAACVIVNERFAAQFDPRIASGGRRQSGFGQTRGAAGLLAMTRPKTVVQQNGGLWLEFPPTTDADVFRSYLAAAHGRNWRDRVQAALEFLAAIYRRQRNSRPVDATDG